MGFTFFFRDNHTLSQLIRECMRIFPNESTIKVWDAGCSNGSEPFTLAILLAEFMGVDKFNRNVTIYASDKNIESGFDKLIESGEYPYHLLSRLPDGILEKYFTPTDRDKHYKVNDNLLTKVKFVHHDLTTYKPFENNFHMILCKNVLLHLTPEERTGVVKMFHSTLLKGGLFCTEQTQPLPVGTENLYEKIVSDANVFQKLG
jgi:chemotaxis protein methyltransferase CheR